MSKKKFLIPLIERPYRDAETLLPIIKKYILQGSTIISDKWAAYNKLSQHGYIHQTVNHSEHFVDPDSGAHTQNIERLWKDIKSWVLKSGIRKQYFKQYFSRYIFNKNFDHPKHRLHHFLLEIATLYPPGGPNRQPQVHDVEGQPGPSGIQTHQPPPHSDSDPDDPN